MRSARRAGFGEGCAGPGLEAIYLDEVYKSGLRGIYITMEETQKIEVFFRTNLNRDNVYMQKVEMYVTDKMDTAFAQVRIYSSARAGSPDARIGVRVYQRNHKGRLVRRSTKALGFWNPGDWVFQRKATGRLVRATQTPAELGIADGETIYYGLAKRVRG